MVGKESGVKVYNRISKRRDQERDPMMQTQVRSLTLISFVIVFLHQGNSESPVQ